MPQNPAIFLDKDGTIIHNRGYINKPSQVIFYPFSFQTLQQLQDRFLFYTISNQSGISKETLSEPEVITEKNYSKFNKTNPFFIEGAATKRNKLTVLYVSEDHSSDAQRGVNAGVTPLLLLSGYGRIDQRKVGKGTSVFSYLSEASSFILSTTNS